MEQQWLSAASVRQNGIKELGQVRFCFDVPGLLGCQEGDSPLSSRAWVRVLGTRCRLGAPVDTVASRLRPGCGELSCHSLGTYGRHSDLRNKFTSLREGPGRGRAQGFSRRDEDTVVHGLFEVPVGVHFVLRPVVPKADAEPELEEVRASAGGRASCCRRWSSSGSPLPP